MKMRLYLKKSLTRSLGEKRESFYEFDSDEEMATADVESEFMEFFKDRQVPWMF